MKTYIALLCGLFMIVLFSFPFTIEAASIPLKLPKIAIPTPTSTNSPTPSIEPSDTPEASVIPSPSTSPLATEKPATISGEVDSTPTPSLEPSPTPTPEANPEVAGTITEQTPIPSPLAEIINMNTSDHEISKVEEIITAPVETINKAIANISPIIRPLTESLYKNEPLSTQDTNNYLGKSLILAGMGLLLLSPEVFVLLSKVTREFSRVLESVTENSLSQEDGLSSPIS